MRVRSCVRRCVFVIFVIHTRTYTDALPSLPLDGVDPLTLDEDNAIQGEGHGLEGAPLVGDGTLTATTVTDTLSTDGTDSGDETGTDAPVTDDVTETAVVDDATGTEDVTDAVTPTTATGDVTDAPGTDDVTGGDKTTKHTTTARTTTRSDSKYINSPIKLKDFVFWPNGTVPFYINTDHFDHEQAMRIMMALSMIAYKSCVKFAPTLVPPSDGQHVLVFANPLAERKCEPSTDGQSPDGPHILVLGYRCLLQPPLLSTLVMRALGLPFEHSRMIRDLYVDVQLENVESGALHLFAKESRLPPELRSLPYDINSVLHFGERDFSKNGHRTIIIKDPKTRQRRTTLTETDIRKLELVYGPECLKRDRQEKIEICQNYPNIARRKRSIGERSLRINPDITPPPNILEDNIISLEDLDVANDTKEVIDKVNDIINKVILNARKKHCNDTSVALKDKTTKTTTDILEINRHLTDLAAHMVDNITRLCLNTDSVDNYQQSQTNERRKRDLDADRLNDGVIEEDMERELKRSKRAVDSPLVNTPPGAEPKSASSEVSGSEEKDPEKLEKERLKLQEEQKATFEQYKENMTNLENLLRSRADSMLPETVPLSKINEEFYEDRRWNHGVVYYYIEREMDEDAVRSLRRRLDHIDNLLEASTCVRLREVDSDPPHKIKDYLYINDASDFVTGKVGGRQVFGCVELFEDKQHRQFTAMMVMAMLGFYFEVARHDRDKYLKVHNRNIRPDKLHHFEKLGEDATLDLPYDFRSATQPAWGFWRRPGRAGVASVATYKTHDPNGKVMKEMGQNKKLLSEIDIIKINSVYGTKCMKTEKEGESSKEAKKSSEETTKKHNKKRKHE